MSAEAIHPSQPPFTIDDEGVFHYGRVQLAPEMLDMAMRSSQLFGCQRHIVAERLGMAEQAYKDTVLQSIEDRTADPEAMGTLLETLSSEVQFLHQVLSYIPGE